MALWASFRANIGAIFRAKNAIELPIQYSPTVPPKFMLKRKDLTRETLNATDDAGDSPLLRCIDRKDL